MSESDYHFHQEIRDHVQLLVKEGGERTHTPLTEVTFHCQNMFFGIERLEFNEAEHRFVIEDDVYHSYRYPHLCCPLCEEKIEDEEGRETICHYFKKEKNKDHLICAINDYYQGEKEKFEALIRILALEVKEVTFKKKNNEYLAHIQLHYTFNEDRQVMDFTMNYSKIAKGWNMKWYYHEFFHVMNKSVFDYHENKREEVGNDLNRLLQTIEDNYIIPNEIKEIEELKKSITIHRILYDKYERRIELYFHLEGVEETLYYSVDIGTNICGIVQVVDEKNDQKGEWTLSHHFAFLSVDDVLYDYFEQHILKDPSVRLKYLFKEKVYHSDLYKKIKNIT